MSDRFREAFSNAVKRIEERQWVYGILGRKNSDGTFTFDVPGRRGFLYVTIRNAAGAQTVIPARNDFGVEQRPNLGIRMKLEHGIYVIWGKANRSDLVHTPETPAYGIPDHPISSHSDIPAYTTNAGKLLAVKTTEDGVEWVVVPVTSVNGQTGAVVLDTDDIAEGVTNLYLDSANLGLTIAGASGTGTVVDTDEVVLVSGTTVLRAAWSTIKTTLTTLFDGLYVGLTGNQTVAGIKTFSSNILASVLRASSAAGLRLEDDAGNLGVFVQDGGNVGIGTTSPQGKLHVYDATENANQYIQSGAERANLFIVSGGTNKFARFGFIQGVLASTVRFDIGMAEDASENLYIGNTNLATKFLTITPSGNVGIGTVNPQVALHVQTSALAGATYNGGDPITIERNLSANINIITPTNANGGVLFSDTTRARGAFFYNHTDDALIFWTAGAEKFRVDSNGNVAIGPAVPQSKLHVHDGVGGSMFVTKTGVNGTAQTIIANGTGDVLRHCFITGVLWATDGSMSRGFTIQFANNASTEVDVDAPTNANGVTFAVSSAGALTIQRTTGSKTYTFAGHIVWL